MLIAIAVICVLIEAVFTCLEVAFGAVSRARLRTLMEHAREQERSAKVEEIASAESGAHTSSGSHASSSGETDSAAVPRKVAARAARTLRLLEHPERLTLLFISVTSLTLWTSAGALTWQAISRSWPPLYLAGAFVLVLFFAEVLPLLIAARNPESTALALSGVASRALVLLQPLLVLFGGVGRGAARLLGARASLTAQVTEGELRTALAAAEEEGVIESDERAMLEGAITFRERRVQDVMTPRVDIVAVECHLSLKQVLDVAMEAGHSRLPVYNGSLDTIVGIIAAKDLIQHLRRADANRLLARDIVREAFFVPPNKRIAPTLEELRRKRSLMALVIDADGATAGLVTLEDLLEEIVGEIQDEYDDEEPPVQVLDESAEARERQDRAAGAQHEGVSGHSAAVAARVEHESSYTVLCEADTNVRETAAFWRRQWGAMLRLRQSDGELAEGNQSLAALALLLFDGVPETGDRVQAGTVLFPADHPVESVRVDSGRADNSRSDTGRAENGRSDNDRSDNGRSENGRGEPARFDSELTVELEVREMAGPRIETVVLRALASDDYRDGEARYD